MFSYLIKEMAETLVRSYRRFTVGATSDDKIKTLKKDGLVVVPNFLTKEHCAELCNKIDMLISSDSVNVWSDDVGSDKRIYFVNQIDSEFNIFYENKIIRNVLKNYTGSEDPDGMLLAARIEYKDNNKGSGGGWHRDSPVTHQFKAICYLNDVDEKNGPFQFIKASHNKINAISSCLNKVFKAGQYRFNENEISNYLKFSNSDITSVIGDAGTIAFADTKAIHRGKPLEEGVRYVLFCYFWHKGIPKHFDYLKQRDSG